MYEILNYKSQFTIKNLINKAILWYFDGDPINKVPQNYNKLMIL